MVECGSNPNNHQGCLDIDRIAIIIIKESWAWISSQWSLSRMLVHRSNPNNRYQGSLYTYIGRWGGLGVGPPWTKKIDHHPWTILDPSIEWRKRTLRFFSAKCWKKSIFGNNKFKKHLILLRTLYFCCFLSFYPICGVKTGLLFYCESITL